MDGNKIEVVADSGAGATLIARELYEKLKDSSMRMRQGIWMRLVQLTGDIKCEGYVTLSLYFQSQLGLDALGSKHNETGQNGLLAGGRFGSQNTTEESAEPSLGFF